MSLLTGTAYPIDTTISTDTVVFSPAEIRSDVTVTIDGTGTLTIRRVEIADLETEMDLYSP